MRSSGAIWHWRSWSTLPPMTWWRHQMVKFSALLTFCVGHSPVTGSFPAQRPVTRSIDVFFDLCLSKWLNKQSWGWWFESPSCSLWRHCNDVNLCHSHVQIATHNLKCPPHGSQWQCTSTDMCHKVLCYRKPLNIHGLFIRPGMEAIVLPNMFLFHDKHVKSNS